MISVIVPVFNAEKTIKDCLDSLTKQSVPRNSYEIIVIDDGSYDRTAKIVRKFPQVKYFLKKNAGPASARNFGVQQAAGDILLFIDSDCEADLHWIEQMAKPFQDPEVKAVKGVYQTKQRSLISRLIQVEFEERYSKMARSKGLDFMDFSAGAVRKDVFNLLGGFDEALKMSEDVQFAYKLSGAGHRIAFTKEGVVYHQHPSTVRNYLRVKFWRSFWRMDVYKNYPQKVLRDSYTPQTLKMQILGVFVFLLTLGLWAVIPVAKYFLFAEIVFLFLMIAPLSWRALRKNIILGLLMPWFQLGRALALGLGIFYYFLEIKNFRELLSFIILALIVIIPSFFTGGRDLIARTFVGVLIFPLLFFAIRADKKPFLDKIPKRYNLILPLAVFFIVALILIFLSVSPYDSYNAYIQWLTYGLLFFAAYYLVSSFAEAQKFSYLIIFSGVILSIIAIYFFVQTEFYTYLRAISTFYQHNPFAGFLLFVLPLCFANLLYAKKLKIKIVLFFVTAFIALTFALTHSRGAWLSFAVPFLVILIYAIRDKARSIKKLPLILLVIIIMFLTGVGWWGMTELKSYQAGLHQTGTASEGSSVGYSLETENENAVVARLNFWNGAKDIFLHNPVTGTGLDTFKITYREFMQDIRYYSIDPHNIYLKMFAELGIIGGLVFLWLVAIILFMVFKSILHLKNITHGHDKALMLGLSMGLLGSLSHNFVDFDWQFPTNLILFFVVLGVFYKLFLISRKQQPAESFEQGQNIFSKKSTKIIITASALVCMILGLAYFTSQNFLVRGQGNYDDLNTEQAVENFQQAIFLGPFNYEAYSQLSRAYFIMIPDDVEKYLDLYIQSLEKSIKYSKRDYSAYADLGRHYVLTKDYDKAEDYLGKAIEYNPVNRPELYLFLATVYNQQNKVPQAVVLLERGVNQYSPALKDSVIWITNNRAKVINDISSLHAELGILYFEIGQANKAQENYSKALEYNSENSVAQKGLTGDFSTQDGEN